MNLIVAGGRDFNNYPLLKQKLDLFLLYQNKEEVTILCGMAKGADLLGKKYAYTNNIDVWEYPANWDKYGKSAGHIRNKQMADDATHLVAFWNGTINGSGTYNMIQTAEKFGLQVRVVRYETR